MSLPFELALGLRYLRAGRRGRRKDGFMSFISGMSVASIALGVAALIIVLSVMNGFQKEVRDRMLSVLSHVEVVSLAGAVPDWEKEASDLKAAAPEIVAAAPFVAGQGLFSSGRTIRASFVRGIDPAEEPKVSDIAQTIGKEALATLTPGSFHIALGSDLARLLGVSVGDKVTLIVPKGNVSPAGFIPRMKQMTVSALFRSGHYEYDSTLALTHLDDAAVLYKTGGPAGLRIKVVDMSEAPAVASQLTRILPRGQYATDWTQQNRTWFAAVQVEKRMMAIILFLIVLVGAFGLVSSLVMTVTEKRSDIAVLRTMGASRLSVMAIFIVQGAFVALMGVAIGVGGGLLIACNLDVIVPTIESILGTQFLPKEIYFISQMPSDPRAGDIIPISILSFLLSLAATLYPSWRASKVHPAEALRYE